MKLFRAALLFNSTIAFANSATQTNWSGGPGMPGPESSWGSHFDVCDEGIDWARVPGAVDIKHQVVEIHIGTQDGASSICGVDMDGDGSEDVLAAAHNSDQIRWFDNANGDGTLWTSYLIGFQDGAICVRAVDIDDDGDLDVIGAGWNDNTFAWWENENGSGTIWTKRYIADQAGPLMVASADIDGDGSSDVIGTAANIGSVFWWDNADGQGTTWIEHLIADFTGWACGLDTGDIDGDGDYDVAVSAAYYGSMVWLENLNGLGTSWGSHMFASNPADTSTSVCLSDLDGDGDLDILHTIWTGEVGWSRNMDGIGETLYYYVISSTMSGATSVCSSDLDGDGDLDVIATAFNLGRIRWFEASPIGWIQHDVCSGFSGASEVDAGDINGDGYPDVLGSGFMNDAFSWFDLAPYTPGSCTLISSILYTGCDPDWASLECTASTPAGTSVLFQVRSSDNPSSMGAWSDTLSSPCSLHGVLEDNSSFVQYKAILKTDVRFGVPTLNEVTISWNPLGVGEGDEPWRAELLPVEPNPCSAAPLIEFGLSSSIAVEITVIDISGRLVQDVGPSEYQPGWYTIQLGELRPGIYFITMQAGEFTANQRFAVVD